MSEWAVGAFKPKNIAPCPSEQLLQIAKDIVGNLVFTSLQVKNQNDLSMIFTPLVFGVFKESTEEYVNDIGMIYEYYSKAGPMSVNGYPIFYSFCLLSKHDTKIVLDKVVKIQSMMEAMV